MNQDWEWEDLLSAQEKEKKKSGTGKRKRTSRQSASGARPVKKSGTASGTSRKKPKGTGKRNAGEESSRQSNLLVEGIRQGHGEAPGLSSSSSKKKKRSNRNRKRAKGRRSAKRRRSVFPFFYIALLVLLTVAGAVIVRGVYKTMEELRDNTPDTYIRRSIESLTDQDLTALFTSNPAYETPGEAAANIRAYMSDGELAFKRTEHNAYDVFKGDRKLFSVKLNASRTVNKLGLLNYDILESAGIQPVENGELFHYEITAPSSCEITVNGKPVGEPVSKTAVDGFADAADYVTLPSTNTYVIDFLTKEPDLKVTDNGRDVPVTLSEKIDLTGAPGTGHAFATTDEAGIDFDAMGFAKDWAMFMRDDLGGEAHGYYKLEPFFIKDTALQKKAYQWASNVDITFTSTHTLMDPPFTDEQVSGVTKYDENAASVDVSLKMHMVLDRGQERTDVIDTTLYLVKQDGAWKVVNIRDDSSSETD